MDDEVTEKRIQELERDVYDLRKGLELLWAEIRGLSVLANDLMYRVHKVELRRPRR